MSNTHIPIPSDRILEEANLKLALAKKHLKALSNFGLTQQWINQMQDEIDTVMTIPSFDLQKAELKALTATKDQKLTECVEWGRTLRLRMDLATSDNQLKNVEFPRSRWSECEKNESKLITFFPTLINLAKTYTQALATVGQTPEYLKQGEKLLKELAEANQAQEEYNIERKTVTVRRKTIYRSLYDKINRINQIGQMVFKNDPEIKVLFESSWSQDHTTASTNDTDSELIEPTEA